MYNDDIPEPVSKTTLDEVLIEDLEERLQRNKERLDKKVDAKGQSLTDYQLESLTFVIHAQEERLERMKGKNENRRTKKASNTSTTGTIRKDSPRKKTT